MPIPSNPGFETAGATPGLADQWDSNFSSAGWVIADFSGGGALPISIESFNVGWSTSPFFLLVSGGPIALFDVGQTLDANTRESFKYWDNNQHYQLTVNLAVLGTFNTGSDEPVEGFESNYGNNDYLYVLAPGDVTGTFHESFTPPGSYFTTVAGGAPSQFRLGASEIEDFEHVFANVRFVVDALDTTLCTAIDAFSQAVAHGMAANFALTTLTDGTRPAGLHDGVIYYVKSPTTTTFKLSLTPGGTAINLLDGGTGKQSVHADERLFWTDGG